jgi:hypothetical protein
MSDELTSKVLKHSETTTGEQCQQTPGSYVLPSELEHDIKPVLEKLVQVRYYH